jgi:hypothetical protein
LKPINEIGVLRQVNNVEPLWIRTKIANHCKQSLAWNIGIKRRANVNRH